MKLLALLLAAVPALNALCLVNSCDSYWSGAQAKLKKDGACAVLFDENCCKASKDHLVVKKGEQGKLCGTGSGLNPLSSCKGSGLKDDIEVSFCLRCILLLISLVCWLVVKSLPQPALFFEGSGALKTTLKSFL